MIGQLRSTQRYKAIVKDDEEALRGDIIRFATQYGRYGYRRIEALLREAGRTDLAAGRAEDSKEATEARSPVA